MYSDFHRDTIPLEERFTDNCFFRALPDYFLINDFTDQDPDFIPEEETYWRDESY